MGIHYFLIFALKHRLWVLVRTASARCTPNLCFEQKYEKSQKISAENCQFYSREKSRYVAWARFRNAKTGKKRFYYRDKHPKDADSIANSEDPDQTAPLGAV